MEQGLGRAGMARGSGQRGPCCQKLIQVGKLLHSAIESSQTLLVFGYPCALFLALWDLDPSLLEGRGGGSDTRGCRVEMNQVGAPSLPPFPPPVSGEADRPASGGRKPSPGMSADASVAPLPQGPWTPVLLGPSASESPSPSRPLPPHGAEQWQQLLQKPGRKETAEPPL